MKDRESDKLPPMEKLPDLADERLGGACVYCNGDIETRDHVPTRCLLNLPHPPLLAPVGK